METVFNILDLLMMTVSFIGYVVYFIKMTKTCDLEEKIDNGVRSIILCVLFSVFLLK